MTLPSPGEHTLVIGWGNELRSDDAAGLHFVRRLAAGHLPKVETMEVPQLTPELAFDVAEAEKVIFVDAGLPDASPSCREPKIKKVDASKLGETDSRQIPTCIHSLGPEGVLQLAEGLYDRRPEAWILSLPVASFAIGFGLSVLAEEGINQALRSLYPEQTFSNPVPL